MAALLDAIPLAGFLGAEAAIGILMILLWVTAGVLVVLDGISILGFRPFAGLADLIRNTIVAGLNDAISALEHWAADCYAGLAWSIRETLKGIEAFAHGVDHLGEWAAHEVNVVLHGALDKLQTAEHHLARRVNRLEHHLKAEVQRLEHVGTGALAGAEAYALNAAHAARTEAEAYTDTGIAALKTTLETELAGGVSTAESAASTALSTLSEATTAAITAATTAETATAGELRDLLNGLDPAKVAALIAAVPLLQAALATLEAEAGLTTAECRSKVGGICGTPSSSWFSLLEGLAAALVVSDLHELLGLVEEAIGLAVEPVKAILAA